MSLFDIYNKFASVDNHYGSDKGTSHSYLDFYVEILSQFKNYESLNILEIGAFSGGWAEALSLYLPNAKIISLDIDISHLKFGVCNPNICFKNIDATDEKTSMEFENQTFDIIIDDGSHVDVDILKSLELYLPKLKDKGIYIIEDISLPSYPNLVKNLTNFCLTHKKNFKNYDLRHIKGRFDDYIFMIGDI